jgi:hypothetical protein
VVKEFVLVPWFSTDSIGGGEARPRQELRKFNSRGAAVTFVMEERLRKPNGAMPA